MKATFLAFCLVLPLTLVAGEVQRGDSIENVRAALGAPRGRLQVGSHELFYYDRGEVELTAGSVTRVALRSAADQAALDGNRAAAAVRLREEQEVNQARLSAEGDALKARKLSDPVFLATPLSYQIAFWEDFSRRYAAVPSAEQLQAVRARLAEQRESSLAQAQLVAELQARAAEAEARTAEANARTAEANARANRSASLYPWYSSLDYSSFSRESRGDHSGAGLQSRPDQNSSRNSDHAPKPAPFTQTSSPWDHNDTWLGTPKSPTDSSRF